ncbi:MAG: hypothetical protein ACKORY_13400, partial [Actinomycetota bacterium]
RGASVVAVTAVEVGAAAGSETAVVSVAPRDPPQAASVTRTSAAQSRGLMLRRPSTRRRGALAAVWLYVLVYPANLYLTWDWRNRPVGDQIVSWVRLPFQFVFIWVSLRVASASDDRPAMPGEPA